MDTEDVSWHESYDKRLPDIVFKVNLTSHIHYPENQKRRTVEEQYGPAKLRATSSVPTTATTAPRKPSSNLRRLGHSIATDYPYQTPLNPSAADPSCCHPSKF